MSRAPPLVPVIPTAVSAPLPATEPDVRRLRNSIDSAPVDWATAVRAARVLLEEMFGLPGSTDDASMTDMAQELAARLCAYHEILGAAEHMRAGLPDRPDLP